MVRMGSIKWEKSFLCRPNHNIISSDFPKYSPYPWKYLEGPPRVEHLLSNEYQRMWLEEREAWNKRMYPENVKFKVDIVKRYILTFKTNHQPPKQEKKKPFRMKKFDSVKGKTEHKRPSEDKAMSFEKSTEMAKITEKPKPTEKAKPTEKTEN